MDFYLLFVLCLFGSIFSFKGNFVAWLIDENHHPRKETPPKAGVSITPYQERESSDKPKLKAFWRVAPSVLFKLRAMTEAGVLFRARVFNVRT